MYIKVLSFFVFSSVFAFSTLFLVTNAAAQEVNNGCQVIYGGGATCIQTGDLVVDKKIRNPETNRFVDHLNANEPQYAPDQSVVFQLTFHNTGNRALENVSVTDVFPQYVTFAKGPGQFDREQNTLTFSLNSIAAGQTRSITIEGKVASAQAIPASNGALCVVNRARAEKDRNISTDNVQFCLQAPQTQQPGQTTPQPTPGAQSDMPVYEAPGVTTSPNTGPELLGLIGLLPLGAAGVYLRRKASK